PSWARPKRWPWHNYVWGLGRLSPKPIYATRPGLDNRERQPKIKNQLRKILEKLLHHKQLIGSNMPIPYEWQMALSHSDFGFGSLRFFLIK
ncbi:hypothetical protein, partial [Comamonas sp. 4034]|uniref:hypothetical protein n=1 Tax=Comamonas sp. 4034 TaxID=3156455 RepID=UPI003D252B6A